MCFQVWRPQLQLLQRGVRWPQDLAIRMESAILAVRTRQQTLANSEASTFPPALLVLPPGEGILANSEPSMLPVEGAILALSARQETSAKSEASMPSEEAAVAVAPPAARL